MKHVRLFTGFAFALATLFGSECSESDDFETAVRATAVQLDNTTLSLEAGASVKLVATVLPEDATDKRVEWSSSDYAIATVDDNGTVTAVGEGTATITVTTVDGGHRAGCTVNVKAAAQEVIAVTEIRLDKATLSLETGSAGGLVATVLPEDATDKREEWSSSDSAIASVDDNGTVTAVAKGTATITVTTVDGGKRADCLVSVASAALNVVAEGDAGPLHWILTDDGILSFSGTGDMPDFDAMSMGADRPWTPYKGIIRHVELPDGVTSIGVFAFAECSALETIAIPSGVASLGDYAFAASGIEEIVIPGSVRTISPGAFTNCPALARVGFAGSGLEIIGDNAFSASAVENIDLPEGVLSIGASAFHNCRSLRSISIPGSVADFGRKPFEGCTDLAVTIGDGMNEIADELFYGCAGLRSVSIPGSIERIGKSAFRDCTDLQEAVLPHGVAVIDAYAFNGCGALTHITIPASVETIGDMAFAASGLASILFPESVTSIGERAFSECGALAEITLSDSVQQLGSNAFAGCGALKRISFGKGLDTIPASAFSATGLETLTIPQHIANIGNDAFAGCKLLTELNIGSGVIAIGTGAFRWCDALEHLTIPDSVKTIGDLAFANCPALADLTLGANLKSFEMMTFNNCPTLLNVTCTATVPPLHSTLVSGISMNFSAAGDTLRVPAGCKAAYEADTDWRNTFTAITEM